jgi:hypothetical protein
MYDENEHRACTGALPESAMDLIHPHLGPSTPPETLKLKLVWGEKLLDQTDLIIRVWGWY